MSEKSICIDPYDGEQIVNSLVQGEKLDILLNTHQHHDHIRGNQDILNHGAHLLDRNHKEIALNQDCELKRIHTPGHTDDSDSLLLYEQGSLKAIFGGDTLFVGGVGNCYNGGNAPTLATTLIGLDKTLNADTIIYPGHDYWESNKKFALTYFSDYQELVEAINDRDTQRVETTWGEEKKHNCFLRALFDESFRQKYFEDSSDIEAFCKIRKMRDNF